MLKRFVKYRFLRILIRLTLGLLLFFVALVLLVRSPWGQDLIVGKAVDYIASKTETEVSIDKLFLTFSGNLELDGLYLEDQQQDTLVYSESLEVSVALWPLIRSQGINVKGLYWQGLKARVKRTEPDKPFNYQFLINAFVPPTDTVETVSSSENSMPVKIGEVSLERIDLIYIDALTAMEARALLGELSLTPGDLDLENMDFTIEQLTLTNSDLFYQLGNAPVNAAMITEQTSETTDNTVLPAFTITKMSLDEVGIRYSSLPDRTTADISVGKLRLTDHMTDLTKQEVSLGTFSFDDSELFLKQLPPDSLSQRKDANAADTSSFTWPEWKVQATSISLRNNQYRVQLTETSPKPGQFDPGHIELYQADLQLSNVLLIPGKAQVAVNRLNFVERSGFQLKELNFAAVFSTEELSVKGLELATQSNFLSGGTTMRYDSPQQLIDEPMASSVQLDFDSLLVNPAEFSVFSPDLLANDYLQIIARKPIWGKLALSGSEAALQVEDIALRWGKGTSLDLNGSVQNLTDTARLDADMRQIKLRSTRADINALMAGQETGLNLPRRVQLLGSARGGMEQGEANFAVNTSDGNLALKGKFTNEDSLAVTANLSVRDLLLGKVLANEQLDTLSMVADLTASGTSLNDLTADFDTQFQKLRFNGYDYSTLSIKGDLTHGDGILALEFKDRNLDVALQSRLSLDSVAPEINSVLTLKGADLFELGLTDEVIRTAFTLSADFKGNIDEFVASLRVRDGQAVYQGDSYSYGNFDLNAKGSADTLFASINSRMLEASVVANRNFDQLMPALESQLGYYFNGGEQAQSTGEGAVLKASVSLRQSPILSEVFLQSLERLDTVKLQLSYDQNAQSLQANLLAPHISYQGSELDSVKLSVNGLADALNLRAGWSEINAGPVSIDQGLISGRMKEGVMDTKIAILDDTSRFLNINSQLTFGDTLRVKLTNESLIFDQKKWSVMEENELVFATDFIDVNNFELTNGKQSLVLSDEMPDEEKAHIAAIFENYQLSNLIGFLNPGESLADGTINGNLIVEEPLGTLGLVAGLNITNLSAMNVPLGRLTLDARAVGSEKYSLALDLQGDDINLNVTGDYQNTETTSDMDLKVSLKSLQTSLVEKFSQGQLKEAQGSMSGSFSVKGSAEAPKYEGEVAFNKAGFLVDQLNTSFSIDQERLKIDNKALYLKDFTIADGDDNTFNVDGSIFTEDLTNPAFDLRLKANNFAPINSTRADSDFFYGQVSVNANLQVGGDLEIPRVRGSIHINEGSAMTVIVPESEVELKAREGVVVFVNRENPDDILTREAENEPSALGQMLSGFDIETTVDIGRNSVFNIIIDERTGDNLQVKGTGAFTLGLEPNGRTRLSGKYELSGGHLEIGLYGLVGRKFEIVPGSNINWLGDPMEAALDIRALYRIKTSAGPLMAERTTSDAQIEAAYRQKLPFEVYINIGGMLLLPEISFNIDMAEDERGALGGAVYAQLEQLNAQEDELNKQVFSLLVLNAFYTSTGSDGSSGGPASLAIDNVTSVLEGQLNKFSDQVFGKTGVQLGFDINNSTDQGGNRATQVDISAKRQFLNDRLIVQVGSEVDIAGGQSSSEGTPIIGNVSVEYLITRDRRLRLQGFNRNVYEGVIDGQLTVSGIAFIFSREFNKFSELWVRQIKEGEEQKQKKKKSKKK